MGTEPKDKRKLCRYRVVWVRKSKDGREWDAAEFQPCLGTRCAAWHAGQQCCADLVKG